MTFCNENILKAINYTLLLSLLKYTSMSNLNFIYFILSISVVFFYLKRLRDRSSFKKWNCRVFTLSANKHTKNIVIFKSFVQNAQGFILLMSIQKPAKCANSGPANYKGWIIYKQLQQFFINPRKWCLFKNVMLA